MGKCSATLNVRELRFIEAVTADPEANATEAARKAGYSDSSDNALAVQGHTLLSRPKIQAAIEARIRDAAKAACLSPEYVLAGLMAIAERAAADRAYGAATPAQTQLGRQLQMFTDHVTVTEVNQRAAEIARAVGLDPAELEELKRETMKLLTPLR